jgi:hypothetical protein
MCIYRDIILSGNTHYNSLRLFHMTAGIATLAATSVCCYSMSTHF